MIDREYARKLSYHIFRKISQDKIDKHSSGLVSAFEAERKNLFGKGLADLWDQLLSNYKGYEQGKPLLVSEKALACLIRRGADRKSIQIKETEATVHLKNSAYYVEKLGAACIAGPVAGLGVLFRLPLRWIRMSGEELANFMFDFDSLIPDFEKELDSTLFEFKVKSMQYGILRQSVDGLGELYLKPLNISWQLQPDFSESDIFVIFADGKHFPLRETIPLNSLLEAIRSIPEKMNSQRPLPHHRPGRWSDDAIWFDASPI